MGSLCEYQCWICGEEVLIGIEDRDDFLTDGYYICDDCKQVSWDVGGEG